MVTKFTSALVVCLSLSHTIFAQTTPSASIATWKNDAAGTYNIIHDDFGDAGVDGIQNYADTIFANRGLKFTFGAITSSCEQRTGMYDIAKKMIARGHEIINHSHTHSCAVANQNCGGTGVNYAWAEKGTYDFADEIDLSTNSIKANTALTPRFFIYPYDQFNDTANIYLRKKGYIGSRTGDYNATEQNNFTSDEFGFFQTALMVDVITTNGETVAQNLNYWVDQAIANKTWVNRELHNVGSTGWGRVGLTDYRNHINYLKQKVAAGQLWVGTISEILTYQIQKNYYSNPITNYDAAKGEINISWATPSFDVGAYLSALQVKSPLTIKVNLSGLSANNFTIVQNNKTISKSTLKNGFLYFDAYPHEGSISIQLAVCKDICFLSQPSNVTIQESGNASFSVLVTAAAGETITYQWYKNNQIIAGATTASLGLTNVALADSGSSYYVKVTAGSFTSNSLSATLAVQKKTIVQNNTKPYLGTAAAIPGKVEIENYDTGGKGLAFNDINTYVGEANTYRNDDVDLENCNDVGNGYSLGYTVAGEWLVYTVDVKTTGVYEVDVRYATQNNTAAFQLYLNDTAITSNTSVSSTGGWSTWVSKTITNIPLKAGDNKILKFAINGKDGNYNYLNFRLITPVGLENANIVPVTVYPNPSEGVFNFLSYETGEYSIFNGNGEVLANENFDANQDITFGNNLKPGVYFLKINTSKGSQIKKIVKL